MTTLVGVGVGNDIDSNRLAIISSMFAAAATTDTLIATIAKTTMPTASRYLI